METLPLASVTGVEYICCWVAADAIFDFLPVFAFLSVDEVASWTETGSEPPEICGC